jgi:hypothetical protein
MSDIDQLKEMLKSKLISKRKAGIEMARQMLAHDLACEPVRVLLQEAAKGDLIMGVQKLALEVLAEDDTRHNPSPFKSPGYVFGGVCLKGHTSYYDKRELCPKQSLVIHRMVRRGGYDVDEIELKCKTCGEVFYAEVPCEGYK